MNKTILDSDSNDSDIFIVKQIKPTKKLTVQQTLILKEGVLTSQSKKSMKSIETVKKRSSKAYNKKKIKSKQSTEKMSVKKQKIETKKQNIKNPFFKMNNKCILSDENNDLNLLKNENKTDLSLSNESLKLEEHPDGDSAYLKTSTVEVEKKSSTEDENSRSENCISSLKPDICETVNDKNQNKEISDTTSTFSYDLNSLLKRIENKTEHKSLLASNELISLPLSSVNLDEERCKDNSEILCCIFKKLICNEIVKQIQLQEKVSKEGIKFEKLISDKECDVLEKFFSLEENTCKLCVRMLCRKIVWHRVSALNIKDISGDLKEEFELLKKYNFVDVNIDNEDAETQLKLLGKPEIQNLCKVFNVSLKNQNNSTKESLISMLIQNSKQQPSVLELMNKKRKLSRLELLKSEVLNFLGMCVRLNKTVVSTFNKIVLLLSFPHYYNGEEDKRLSNLLYLCIRVFKGSIAFPQYKLSPTVVFKKLEDFEKYEKSIRLQDRFETAAIDKNFKDFSYAGNKAKEEFLIILNDSEYQQRYLSLKPFLKKFSPGTVYARILTKYCSHFRKQISINEVIDITKLLLSQNVFLSRKRGKWYQLLSQAYEINSENNSAAEVLIQSSNDSFVDEVQKLTLQLRGQALLRKKNNNIKASDLKENLNNFCTVSIQEPLSIEIKGKILQGNQSGHKCIYVEDSNNGKVLASVEEKAILHYKSLGFKGFHVEGYIIQTIYFLFFFDIIYEISPEGVFQSSYQEAPLDLYSSSFYSNRKESIDLLLSEMFDWTENDIDLKLKTVYYKNFNTSCVIQWREDFTPEIFCEVTKCITIPKLVLIFQRFLQNLKMASSGFPDLTLWNLQTKKCKFVEVKSPNDKLSSAQRVWLDFLRNIGIECEVCNVKNVSAKSIFS